MKRMAISLGLLLLLALLFGCAKKERFHQADLPDPKSYEAHFDEIDNNGDGVVSWEEFDKYFSQADPRVFETLDLNGDKVVAQDEWAKFRQAHGTKHKRGHPGTPRSRY